MKLNAKKCSLLLPNIIFFENQVNAKELGLDPAKVLAMLKLPSPTCQKKLKGALGMFLFYKQFILNYLTIVITLTSLFPIGYISDKG